MISEEEARTRILEKIAPLPERTVPLAMGPGCFSGRHVAARLPLPAFDNSAMDGYAVIADSCKKGQRLRVTAEQPAGPDRNLSVDRGEAVRIFTGAPVPKGADAIVMQEDVTRAGEEIVVNVDIEAGDFIRGRGCDLAEGQTILTKGERISAANVALLASQGFAEVMVGGEVSAAVLSTGDELVEPGNKIEPGQIYDSNSTLLQALLQRCGAVVNSVKHSGDDRKSLSDAIRSGTENRVLVISGGVSVGEHDLVKDVLSDLGTQIEIWRVAIKPGKPFLFGRVGSPSHQSSDRERRAAGIGEAAVSSSVCFIFGLPGNPVSAFVTFLRFVRPAILKMMGATNFNLPEVPAKLTRDLVNDSDRPHYIRGRLERGTFAPIGRQESHALFGLSQANALLRLGGDESRKGGEIVDVQIWDS